MMNLRKSWVNVSLLKLIIKNNLFPAKISLIIFTAVYLLSLLVINSDFNVICLIIFAFIVGIIYYWVIPSYLFKGQTLGKKICKIKIVTEDYQPVNAKTLFIRDMIASTWIEGGIIITATSIHKLVGLVGYSQIATYWQYLTYIITIISIIYAYFNKQSQSFHDKIAKTIVIKD